MDDVDRAILRELQIDGRIPYADLAPKIGLSPSGTRLRLQRLIDAKAVQVVAVTDPIAMSKRTMALLGLRIGGDSRVVADALSRQDEVVYIVLTSGRFDLLAEVVCSQPRDLLNFINDVVRATEGVVSVESFPYFAIHTHRFLWGVD
ncbi:Lrp/AsnC family transcriptional regulator [Streptomyces sp. NPDC004629]|uniref:Lrp/AsnC family transcriptional regulator n=1 Tax=Streptomyces sp. NPDC004629 TaxID=3364705 RepID=UPI00368B4224